ncbi:unknown protein [Azorhizobium caulinodans ORS 571]|uniref:Uncharacterized protein n=1 Tax=Azorhizobium caulinodans (strain ATCC 43989 / DSM 5975 / JCM 20966 / LMG 6465 / NBRC 14845 / NCIMB 13405 / ORS 571) TaxID=438753 RepID=A8I4Y5_AZOC5|nr:unknown protein [Azorhizobium caulinodans ORS 571]
MLVRLPVEHIICGIHLMSASTKDVFFVHPSAAHMFFPRTILGFHWSERVRRREPGLWNFEEPGIGEELADQIEAKALPLLEPIRTIRDYMKLMGIGEPADGRFVRRMIFEAAMGDLDAARRACCRLWHPDIINLDPPPQDGVLEIPQKLGPLIARDDREGIAAVLRSWEESSAKVYGVEKYWQPTPFPIEETA